MRWLAVIGLGVLVCAVRADQEPRYAKLDRNGSHLPASAAQWDCLLDRQTGLVWEIKADSGMRSRKHTYSWHLPGRPEARGMAGGGRCEAISCDTHAYAQAVNREQLCGRSDWRLPEEVELFTLFFAPGLVDMAYFPDMERASYWSATLGPDGLSPVFVAFYGKGISYWHGPEQSKRVRLVSGKPLSAQE